MVSLPIVIPDYSKQVQVQPPPAEGPLPSMSIGALEVCASGFDGRKNVPAAAALVGDQGEIMCGLNVLDEYQVLNNRLKAVEAGCRGAMKVGKGGC